MSTGYQRKTLIAIKQIPSSDDAATVSTVTRLQKSTNEEPNFHLSEHPCMSAACSRRNEAEKVFHLRARSGADTYQGDFGAAYVGREKRRPCKAGVHPEQNEAINLASRLLHSRLSKIRLEQLAKCLRWQFR